MFLVNYALSQPAKMSTPALGAHGASNAVDGVRHVNLASFSCFHTIYGRGDWWSVDLGVLVNVYAVAITNRGNSFCIYSEPPILTDTAGSSIFLVHASKIHNFKCACVKKSGFEHSKCACERRSPTLIETLRF